MSEFICDRVSHSVIPCDRCVPVRENDRSVHITRDKWEAPFQVPADGDYANAVIRKLLDGPVDIPLPPEPPRDRVIEAYDAEGVVRLRWWSSDADTAPWCDVVHWAMSRGWSLRHRAAEGGGEQ